MGTVLGLRLNSILKIWSILESDIKKSIILQCICLSISSLLEALTVGGILELLSMLTYKSSGSTYQSKSVLFGTLFESVGFTVFCVGFLILCMLSGIFRVFLVKQTFSLSHKVGNRFSCQLYKTALNQDYLCSIAINKDIFLAGITSNVDQLSSLVNGLFQIFSSLSLSVAILISLAALNPFATAMCLIIFTASYLALISANKNFNLELGKTNYESQVSLIGKLKDSLNCIKQIKIDKDYRTLYLSYSLLDKEMRDKRAKGEFLSAYPRLMLESILLIGVILVLIFLGNQDKFLYFIPFLGAYLLAAQKVIPAFQLIYANWNNLLIQQQVINKVLGILSIPQERICKEDHNCYEIYGRAIKELKFENISFSYPANPSHKSKDQLIFDNVSFVIREGDIIGLVGKSGSGKSTLADLLVGLLPPTTGNIYLNNIKIPNTAILRNYFSYIQQHTLLTNGSLKENIIISKDYSETLYNSCLETAALAKPNSSASIGSYVSDNGSNLSGGQKQRIGIARCLYQRKDSLIIDEGTSALDKNTKKFILTNLLKNSRFSVIVLITHSHEDLEFCNKIFKVEQKKIKEITDKSKV